MRIERLSGAVRSPSKRGKIVMTLLDAPKFDERRARRTKLIGWSAFSGVVVLLVIWWLLAGRPVDWPWFWNTHLFGRAAMKEFMTDMQKNDLQGAYGVWIHDKNWQQHPQQDGAYPFDRFKEDWDPNSPDAEFHGGIHSFRIAADRRYGNVLLAAILVNGATQNALDLTWDPHTKELSFAPPGVRLSTVPWAVIP
jgi:hypothetical protein